MSMSLWRSRIWTARRACAILGLASWMAGQSWGDNIDGLVHRQMTQGKVPGVAVMVIRDGHVVKKQGYGFANLELRTPVVPQTVFESGSMGKQFTAALVLMLAQEGKVGLDDSIVKYFPEGKLLWKGVTVRQLLSHTSGLGDMPYDQMDMRKDYTESDLVKLMLKQPISELPGEKWRYNNGGYVLLGILVHRVTGKFYGDLLRSRIFVPLGMKTARIISEKDIVPNRAQGYEIEGGKLRNQHWVSPSLNTTADGSLYLSLDDLQKWDASLYTHRLLNSRSISLMWSPARLLDGNPAVVNPGAASPVCYGFGWTIAMDGPYRCVAHGGGWQGFRSYIARIPDLRLTVVVLANEADADVTTLANSILKCCERKLDAGRRFADSRIP